MWFGCVDVVAKFVMKMAVMLCEEHSKRSHIMALDEHIIATIVMDGI